MHASGNFGWCNEDHKIKWAADAGRKLHQRNKQTERGKVREEKRVRNVGNLPHQVELTRIVFNTMIRLLDRGKFCPTCGEPLIEGTYDAGHVRTVAACPQLRFHGAACFGQCRACNGSGTIRRKAKKTQEVVSELYKDWILKELGRAHFDWLYGFHASPNWTCADLIDMRAVFAAEVSRLKKGLPPTRDWRSFRASQSEDNAA
jgi:hypothetical protein